MTYREQMIAEARRLLATPEIQNELLNRPHPSHHLNGMSAARLRIINELRRECASEIGEEFVAHAGKWGWKSALDSVDSSLTWISPVDVNAVENQSLKRYSDLYRSWLGEGPDPGRTISPFEKCAARYHLRRIGVPEPSLSAIAKAAPKPAAAPAKPAPKPKRPPPPQIEVRTLRIMGNRCVQITGGGTRWWQPDDPKSDVVTKVVLRNTCSDEQLVEARTGMAEGGLARPDWTLREGAQGGRSVWRAPYPTDRLGFAPVQDMYQVFTLSGGGVMDVDIFGQLFPVIYVAAGSCSHHDVDRERTVFMDAPMTQFVCVNLPWPDEKASEPSTYRPETKKAFARQLADACPAERRDFQNAVADARVQMFDYEESLIKQTKLVLIGTQSKAQREVQTPASTYKRCVILERFRQIDRGWLPSWDVP
jgi:hypothetical protein